MSLIELFLLAVGLSMDAFLPLPSVGGLSTQRLCPRHYLIVGAWFGGFQALMPTLGWLLGSTFAEHITRFDHWIAFVLLALIGGNMIREGVAGDGEKGDDSFSFGTMLLLAVATSIDALAIGVTFALAPPDCGHRLGGGTYRSRHVFAVRRGTEDRQRLRTEVQEPRRCGRRRHLDLDRLENSAGASRRPAVLSCTRTPRGWRPVQ